MASTTPLYDAARTIREDAHRELAQAISDLYWERRRQESYSAISDAVGGRGWQRSRADGCASRIEGAERRLSEARARYDEFSIAAHCALIADGRYDDSVRAGSLTWSGGAATALVTTAMRARAAVIGVDWDAARADYLSRAPEREARVEAAAKVQLALSGQLGREAQIEAQREDRSWRLAGHTIP
jgi:hypothetical protein